METSAAAVLGLGFLLGLRHATDADHVVAVTTFVSRQTSLLRSCWIGIFWGAGHTISLAVAGFAVLLLKFNISSRLENRLELAVAVMLVVLGARVLYTAWREQFELHRHAHTHAPDAAPHSHWHLHPQGSPHEHSGWLHAGLRPLVVGMVHGAAGSGALMLLVLSTMSSRLQALAYISVFGLGSIAGMLLVSLLLALPLQWAGKRAAWTHRPIQVCAGLFSCAFGISLAVERLS